VPLLERAAGIIHVAFVFVKTLTKRCLPAWRPFHLHSRRLVRDNLVFAATSPANGELSPLSLSLSLYRHVLLYRECRNTLGERAVTLQLEARCSKGNVN